MFCLLSALDQCLLPRLMGIVTIASSCRYSFVAQAAKANAHLPLLLLRLCHTLPSEASVQLLFHVQCKSLCLRCLCLHFCFPFPALFCSQILSEVSELSAAAPATHHMPSIALPLFSPSHHHPLSQCSTTHQHPSAGMLCSCSNN